MSTRIVCLNIIIKSFREHASSAVSVFEIQLLFKKEKKNRTRVNWMAADPYDFLRVPTYLCLLYIIIIIIIIYNVVHAYIYIGFGVLRSCVTRCERRVGRESWQAEARGIRETSWPDLTQLIWFVIVIVIICVYIYIIVLCSLTSRFLFVRLRPKY